MKAPDVSKLTLELYALPIKTAVAAAQQLADALSNEVVTVHHLLRTMLEAGIGRDMCMRAAVDYAGLLRTSTEATNKLSRRSKLSYLDAELLATLRRAEAVMSELGRSEVDAQCMFMALAARRHVPVQLANATWTEGELAERPPPNRVSLAEALEYSAKALDGLAEEVAAGCDVLHPPPEVTRTLKKIYYRVTSISPIPLLRGEYDNEGSVALWREGKPAERLILEWKPPCAIVLRTPKQGEHAIFSLSSYKCWLDGDQDLFVAVREAIASLYPEVEPSVSRPIH